MKKYMKLAVSFLAIAVIATATAFAASTNDTSLFNAKEFGLSIGTGYVVDRAAAFQSDYTFNFTAGAFWFPFRNLGLEAGVPFYQSDGVSVDEVQAGLLLRVPLSKSTPLFKNLAPYIGVGGVYNWQAKDTAAGEDWAYIGKAGIEFRLNKKWSVFGEGQYRNVDFDWNKGETSLQGGIRLVF